MAIRRISELPEITVVDDNNQEYIEQSLFEISEMNQDENPESTGGNIYRFSSKSIKARTLKDYITYEILCGPGEFRGEKIFYDHVDFLAGVCIAGDFMVNYGEHLSDFSPEYDIYLNGKNTYISGYNGIDLNSENGPINLTATGYNFYGYNSTTPIFKFDGSKMSFINPNIEFNVGSPTYNIHFGGKAKFDNDIDGVCLSARYADLAEVYDADQDYPFGTLVKFGGDKEVTIASDGVANAVVSFKPGLVMNSNTQHDHSCALVLVGRSPVRISTDVKKFDRLYLDPDNDGLACTTDTGVPIGIALQDGTKENGIVEAVLKMQF